MDNKAGARAVEKLMQQYGHLPSLPDGPIVENFDRITLAAAIEQEIRRCADYGFTKITMHMDVPDAAQLARELRK